MISIEKPTPNPTESNSTRDKSKVLIFSEHMRSFIRSKSVTEVTDPIYSFEVPCGSVIFFPESYKYKINYSLSDRARIIVHKSNISTASHLNDFIVWSDDNDFPLLPKYSATIYCPDKLLPNCHYAQYQSTETDSDDQFSLVFGFLLGVAACSVILFIIVLMAGPVLIKRDEAGLLDRLHSSKELEQFREKIQSHLDTINALERSRSKQLDDQLTYLQSNLKSILDLGPITDEITDHMDCITDLLGFQSSNVEPINVQ